MYLKEKIEKNKYPNFRIDRHGPGWGTDQLYDFRLMTYGVTRETLKDNGLRLTPHTLRIVRFTDLYPKLILDLASSGTSPDLIPRYQTFFICEQTTNPGKLSFVLGFSDGSDRTNRSPWQLTVARDLSGEHVSKTRGDETVHRYELTLPGDQRRTFYYSRSDVTSYTPQVSDGVISQPLNDGSIVQILGINYPFDADHADAVIEQSANLLATEELSRAFRQ